GFARRLAPCPPVPYTSTRSGSGVGSWASASGDAGAGGVPDGNDALLGDGVEGATVLLGVGAGVLEGAEVGVSSGWTTSATSQPSVPLSPRTLRQVRPPTSWSGPITVRRVPSGRVWSRRPVVPGSARRFAPWPPVPDSSTFSRSGAGGGGSVAAGVALGSADEVGLDVGADVTPGVAVLLGVAVGVGSGRSAVETIQPVASPSL